MIKVKSVKVMNSHEATMLQREHFNPYQTGVGLHKTSKKDRRKKDNKKIVREARMKYCYY